MQRAEHHAIDVNLDQALRHDRDAEPTRHRGKDRQQMGIVLTENRLEAVAAAGPHSFLSGPT